MVDYFLFEFLNLKTKESSSVIYIGVGLGFGLSLSGVGQFVRVKPLRAFSFFDLHGAIGRLTWVEIGYVGGFSLTYITILNGKTMSFLFESYPFHGAKLLKKKAPISQFQIGLGGSTSVGIWQVFNFETSIKRN